MRQLDRLVERVGCNIQIACLQTALNSFGVYLNTEAHPSGQFDRKWLCAAHATKACGDSDGAGKRVIEILLCRAAKSLVRPLQYPLRTDVDPGTRGHLTVHHQSRRIEFVELFPCSPMRYKVGV